MNKRTYRSLGILLAIILLVSSVLLIGCKPAPAPAPKPTPPPTPAPAPAPPPAPPLPKTIVFGAGATGSLAYTAVIPLAKVIGDHTPMKVEVLPQGETVWYPMLHTGEVQLGAIGTAPSYYAYMGLGMHKEPTKGKGYNLTTVLIGGPLKTTLAAAKDTNIYTIPDIKGKKVVTEYKAFFAAELSASVYLANAGLTKADVINVAVSDVTEGVKAVIERRADVAITTVAAAMTEEWDRARGCRILPIDTSPEALARAKKVCPTYMPYTHKPGLPGLEKETTTYVIPWNVLASPSLPENAVYEVLKALWQNMGELTGYHAMFKEWPTTGFAVTYAAAPYHPGAIKWYKEQGVWTSQLEAYQKEMLGWK